MKKFLSILMAIFLVFSLTACGDSGTKTNGDVTPSDASVEQTTDVSEWKQFVKDYNEFVDDYLEIVEKYNNNPTDATILTDYNSMLSKVTEWSTKADEITNGLKASPEEATEFAAELSKIAERLANVTK